MPNQQLNNGRFIIQKILGSGGFGVTYSAREQFTNKLVVIKTLNHIQQSKSDFEQRQVKFVNEALRLARCNHPHIVQVYEVIQEEGLWGMVMEYIDGKDLAAYLEQQGILSETEALLYINQIGQALEYVHQQGFLHRDVKPSNIILRNQSEAVLIDFGLAREYTQGQIESMTNDRTNGYAPIEQYKRRGTFGAYTDVYALAATLYTLLTKEVPIPAEYRSEETSLIAPKEYNSQISDRINYAILKGMELQPEARPQSVLEFRELLGLTNTTSPEEEELLSAVGINYSQLKDLLSAGKWQEADEETTKTMLRITGRENDGWLEESDISSFTCADLRTIDKLWIKYSHGRFGFSVQKRLYQNLGGTRNFQQQIWDKFGDNVGWRKNQKWMYYNELNFNINAPSAHLPAGIFWFDSWWGRYGWFLLDGVESRFACLVERMGRCNI